MLLLVMYALSHEQPRGLEHFPTDSECRGPIVTWILRLESGQKPEICITAIEIAKWFSSFLHAFILTYVHPPNMYIHI